MSFTTPQNMTGHSGRIVVGVDGSPNADRALRWAYDQAERHGSTLEVVVAWDFDVKWAPSANPAWAEDADHLSADAITVGENAVARILDGRPQPKWLSVLSRQGTPALQLVEQARGADLLVVGARGRGGFAKLLIGSVSNACVKHASCPVLVIPAERDATV